MGKLSLRVAMSDNNLEDVMKFSSDEIAQTLDGFVYISMHTKSLFSRMMKAHPEKWLEIKGKMTNPKPIEKIEDWSSRMYGVSEAVDLTYDLTNSHDQTAFKAKIVTTFEVGVGYHRFVKRMLGDGTWMTIGELK